MKAKTKSRTRRAAPKKGKAVSSSRRATSKKPTAAKGKPKAKSPKRPSAAIKTTKTAKKSAKRTATRPAGRKAAPAATKRAPARVATSKRAATRAAKPLSVLAPGKNPLTHRGTRPSRTQLLLEHQAAPLTPVEHHGNDHGAGVDHQSNLGELVRETEVRNQMLKSRSEGSTGKRVENILAASSNVRIGGHASGAGRRAQGRRDAAQRGEKRPDKAGFDS